MKPRHIFLIILLFLLITFIQQNHFFLAKELDAMTFHSIKIDNLYWTYNYPLWDIDSMTSEGQQFDLVYRNTRSKEEIQMISHLVSSTAEYMAEKKQNFIFIGGTALGAYRHQGIVPWDDDADAYAYGINTNDLIQMFRENPKFLVCNFTTYLKVSMVENAKKLKFCGHWPFVDIWTLDTITDSHVQQHGDSNYYYPYDGLFPARYLPFVDSLIPVPNKLKEYFSFTYGDAYKSVGKLHHYDHMAANARSGEEVKEFSLNTIKKFFPMTDRFEEHDDRTELSLRKGFLFIYEMTIYKNKTTILHTNHRLNRKHQKKKKIKLGSRSFPDDK